MCIAVEKNSVFPGVIREPERETPLRGSFDVVVAGGGPAGVCAAISAAKNGASVLLLENEGCLGGILTSGLMSNIIDAENKGGLLREILDELAAMGMVRGHYSSVDPEAMKYCIEKRVLHAGICVRLYTRVVAAVVSPEGRIRAVVTESASGREAWSGKIFVDATGNGDLSALAGCKYEQGDSNHRLQAASLCALIYGVHAETIPDLLRVSEDDGKKNLLALLEQAGVPPSYTMPTLFSVSDSGYLLMSNHQYQVMPDDAAGLSKATIAARAELWKQIDALRKTDPRLKDLRIGTTAPVIGLREGRRIFGHYRLNLDDLLEGHSQPDAVCQVTFSIDIHGAIKGNKGYTSTGLKVRPYDIPLRALIARDVSGLLLAGRCISGDFYAHASYRVVGNAAATGEAAGICAAAAVRKNVLPEQVTYEEFLRAGGNPHQSFQKD